MGSSLSTGARAGSGSGRVVRLVGPGASPNQLRDRIDVAAEQGAERIVLALDRHSLLCSDVLDELRHSAADLSADGCSLVVVCPDRSLRGLLEGTGLARDYELAESLEAA